MECRKLFQNIKNSVEEKYKAADRRERYFLESMDYKDIISDLLFCMELSLGKEKLNDVLKIYEKIR